MFSLNEYDIIDEIYSGPRSTIYRGKSKTNDLPLIIKTLTNDFPDDYEIQNHQRDYDIGKTFNHKHIISYHSIAQCSNGHAIIEEDFEAENLHTYLTKNSITPLQFLEIARQITVGLDVIHRNNIIHKDIKPGNILINPESKKIKIIDFSIAARMRKEIQSGIHPENLEGTLSFISPEQTGRMNRMVDYRSDFYSLGVTFYYLLTRKLPFDSKDPVSLVHAHIARQPIPPSILDTRIPGILSNLVMKLLSKSAEERYQTSQGLIEDLEKCRRYIETNDKSNFIKLGEADSSPRFMISQKLFGREKQLAALMEEIELTRQGQKRLLLISGEQGMGKTKLVHEIIKPITLMDGCFVSGKYDASQQSVPYQGIVQAFQEMIHGILSESDEFIEIWKKKLYAALEPNIQIMIDVIPNIAYITGSQPQVVPLDPIEAQNRFNRVFLSFVKVLCQFHKPLVVFLEDLQNCGAASFRLIEYIMSDEEIRNFLVIGTYRDRDIDANHPLTTTIDKLNSINRLASTIELTNYAIENISTLIQHSLNTEPKESSELAAVVYRKTNGNPFFVKQFLIQLYNSKSIRYSKKKDGTQGWQWNLDQIKSRNITENVIEMMLDKIQNLPEITKTILETAACFGTRFSVPYISSVLHIPVAEISGYLNPIIEDNLVISIDYGHSVNSLNSVSTHAFLNNRIQHALYSSINEYDRNEIHLKIGRMMLSKCETPEEDENLFDIVGHLNLGSKLLKTPEEISQLARLNLVAGIKAKESNAYEFALEYSENGMALLNEDAWTAHHDLCTSLHFEAAECSYLNSKFAQAEQLIDSIQKQSQKIEDLVRANCIRIDSKLAQNQPQEAIEIGILFLKKLGFHLPQKANKLAVIFELIRTRIKLSKISITKLENIPDMTDPKQLLVSKLIKKLFITTFIGNQKLLALLIFKSVRFFIKWGYSEDCLFFSHYGYLLSGMLKQFDLGYQYGALNMKLLERFPNSDHKAGALLAYNALLRYWKEPINASLPSLMEGYQSGMKFGQMGMAANCLFAHNILSLFAGDSLKGLKMDMDRHSQIFDQFELQSASLIHSVHRQTVSNFIDGANDHSNLDTERFKENEILQELHRTNDINGLMNYYTCKILLYFIFNHYTQVVSVAKIVIPILKKIPMVLGHVLINFYYSLSLLAIYDDVSSLRKRRILNELKAVQKQMKKWALSAPENFLHKYHLIEAERYRIKKCASQALEYYRLAIEGAGKNKCLNDEAVANELLGRYWLKAREKKIAHLYLSEARSLFSRWGAKAKVRDFEKTYFPQLGIPAGKMVKSVDTIDKFTSISSSFDLDLKSILKALRAISSEIVPDKLLFTFINIIVENSGAQKGYLIYKSDNELIVIAAAHFDNERVKILAPDSVDISTSFSKSIVHYVIRSGENVVLQDASQKGEFIQDPYLKKNRIKSVLCTPYQYKGKRSGALYLENNLISNAFTEKRVELLQALLAQTAVSMQNAELYDKSVLAEKQLRKSETKYRTLVENSGVYIIYLDLEGTILFINPSGAKWFGHRAEKIVGKSLFDYLPAIRKGVLERIKTTVDSGTGAIYEDFIAMFGSHGWTMTSFQPVRDDNNKITSVLIMIQDISETKQTKEDLQRLTAILETTSDFVSTSLPNQKVTYINQAGKKLVGIGENDDISELKISDLHPDWAADLILNKSIPATIKNGIWRGETALINAKGAEIPVSQVIMAHWTENGKLRYLSTIIRDISGRKRIEEKLKEYKEHLEELVEERTKELNEAQTQLIEKAHKAGMADIAAGTLHNVGNLLNSIKTSANTIESVLSNSALSGLTKANELLRDNFDSLTDFIAHNPKGKKLMQYYLKLEDAFSQDNTQIRLDLKRLNSKIDIISEVIVAQQTYAGFENMTEKYSLTTVIEDALTLESGLINRSQITVVRRYIDIPAIPIQKTKLIHILINLLNNAVDAMKDIPIEDKKLFFILERTTNHVYLKVKDTGKGITQDELKKIFTHGFTTKEEGHGFGLHSCANLMEEMNGRMWAQSEGTGKGAVFILEFPTNEISGGDR